MQILNKKNYNYIKDMFMIHKEWTKGIVLIACTYQQNKLYLKWWGLPSDAIPNKICGLIKELKKKKKLKDFKKFKWQKLLLKAILNDYIFKIFIIISLVYILL